MKITSYYSWFIKLTIIGTIWLINHNQSNAQDFVLSLDSAIRIAQKQNPDYIKKQLSHDIAVSQYHSSIIERLPQVEVSSSIQRNLVIPSTPIPAKMFDPNAAPDEIIPAKFTTKYSGLAGIKVNFDLFNPDKYGTIMLDKIKMRQATLNEKQAKTLLCLNIRLDYAAALIAQRQLQLCVADTLTNQALYNYLKNRYDAGKTSQDDMMTAKQNLNDAISRMDDAQLVYDKAIDKLLTDMGYKSDMELISKTILSTSLANLISIEKTNTNLRNLAEEQDQLQVEENKLKYDKSKLGFLPHLSLIGYYGANYYNQTFEPFGTKGWYGNSYIGLSLNLPITHIFSQISRVNAANNSYQVALLDSRSNDLKRHSQLLQIDMEIQKTQHDIYLKKQNFELAQNRHKIVRQKFMLGRVLPYQLSKSQKEVLNYQTLYLQALYNYFVLESKRIHLLQ